MRSVRGHFGMLAVAAAAMFAATPVMEIPAAVPQDQGKRQRKRHAPRPQRSVLAYPSLNRSRKWRQERSYAEAAATTTALGLRDRPLR
jgi:hypothetical protein